MSKRSERREAERLSRKAAYQQLRQQRAQNATPAESSNSTATAPAAENIDHLLARAQAFFEEIKPEPAPNTQISEAQLAANQANAQHSRGPVSAAGKAASSRNSLKHGFTSKVALLPGEDAAEYQRQLDAYIEIFHPANEEELRLVKSQLDCIWRLARIRRIETAIFTKGHYEFANKFEDRDPADRAHLAQAEAFLKYERQLRNLNIQEARIRRTMEKDRAELNRIQVIRKREERAAALPAASQTQQSATPRPNGFVFSTASGSETVNPIPATKQRIDRSEPARKY